MAQKSTIYLKGNWTEAIDCTEKFAEQDYPFQILYKTQEHHILRFRSHKEFNEFNNDVKQINSLADEINNKRNMAVMKHKEYFDTATNVWIPLVEDFIQKWNEKRTPADIQRVYDNVHNELKLHRTKQKWSHRRIVYLPRKPLPDSK